MYVCMYSMHRACGSAQTWMHTSMYVCTYVCMSCVCTECVLGCTGMDNFMYLSMYMCMDACNNLSIISIYAQNSCMNVYL